MGQGSGPGVPTTKMEGIGIMDLNILGHRGLTPVSQEMENDMYIIAGLGNPGSEYELTRHNIGFRVIDELAGEYNISVSEKKHKGLIGKGVIEGQKVVLVKPQTFMNLSGECIREVIDYYKEDIEHFIVVYDDISLDVGKLRVRPKGSAGGHNGIKNIIAQLGTDEFARVKFGQAKGQRPRRPCSRKIQQG